MSWSEPALMQSWAVSLSGDWTIACQQQDIAHSFVDQAKLLSTNHERVLERNMVGIALQECRFEFPCLFFLKAIGFSLWENETSKDLAGQLRIN